MNPHPRVSGPIRGRDRLPLGMAVPGGFFLGLALVVALGAFPGRAAPGGAPMVTVAVELAAWSALGPLSAVVPQAGLWFLLADGFLENTQGRLSWHGTPDAVLLGVLMAAAALGSAAGGGWRHLAPRYRDRGPVLPDDVEIPTLRELPDRAARAAHPTGTETTTRPNHASPTSRGRDDPPATPTPGRRP